jgi:hypothetical protein
VWSDREIKGPLALSFSQVEREKKQWPAIQQCLIPLRRKRKGTEFHLLVGPAMSTLTGFLFEIMNRITNGDVAEFLAYLLFRSHYSTDLLKEIAQKGLYSTFYSSMFFQSFFP